MPKETDEDKAKRKEAMQQALKGATAVPFELMELSSKGLEITSEIIEKSNRNAASDLGVAALNLKAGLQGAWLNVLINLEGITDLRFSEEYEEKGSKILRRGCLTADSMYHQIEINLNY